MGRFAIKAADPAAERSGNGGDSYSRSTQFHLQWMGTVKSIRETIP